jgi:hypothetical protein
LSVVIQLIPSQSNRRSWYSDTPLVFPGFSFAFFVYGAHTCQREREREREREIKRKMTALKGMTGALAPFSYLVTYSKQEAPVAHW